MYLPQYHPIKENDEWWGKGFTEWRNVMKGKQVVPGQYQPHVPADLGFYDLRVPEVRKQQAELAKASGIYGFCYYHYWFHGKKMIDRPFNDVLSGKEPNFPFCLCWANESWTRNWDGKEKQILLKQEYSAADDLNHIRYLCSEVFPDDRYIKVNGKPVFVIYRASSLPNIKQTVAVWRNEAQKAGFPDLHLIHFWAFDYGKEPTHFDMDAAALFTPNPIPVPAKGRDWIYKALHRARIMRNKVSDYRALANYCMNMEYPEEYVLYPCITPMWDNYSRRRHGGATIYTHSTPEIYEKWLRSICTNWKNNKTEEAFLFINAWNEWAEGNHLEPCEKWKHAYLDATRNVLTKSIYSK